MYTSLLLIKTGKPFFQHHFHSAHLGCKTFFFFCKDHVFVSSHLCCNNKLCFGAKMFLQSCSPLMVHLNYSVFLHHYSEFKQSDAETNFDEVFKLLWSNWTFHGVNGQPGSVHESNVFEAEVVISHCVMLTIYYNWWQFPPQWPH